MNITEKNLRSLYEKMSIDEIAQHFDKSKTTIYYYMKKYGIASRSKSEAQKRHLAGNEHQRTGKVHTEETKEKISDSASEFWNSRAGLAKRKRLGYSKSEAWNKMSSEQRAVTINRIVSAPRPKAGSLSKFGSKLLHFLKQNDEVVDNALKLTKNHISDIILTDRKVVIELILPISVYGQDQKQKIDKRYDSIQNELNRLGYRVIIVEDRSNSLSRARCKRVYEQLIEFLDQTEHTNIRLIS